MDQEQAATVTEAIVVNDSHVGPTPERKAFNAAFAKAQGGFQPLVKNRNVTIVGASRSGARVEYQFRYADMQEIDAKTRPALSENGLSTTALTVPSELGVTLALILAHAEGFERVAEVFVKYGEDPKQFGGLLSYMRRYMKQNLLDVAADDDLDEDGQGTDEGAAAAPKPPAPRAARKSDAKPPAAPAVGQFDREPDGRPDPDAAEPMTQTRNAAAVEQTKARAPAAAPVQQSIEPESAPAPATAPAPAPAPVEDSGEVAEIGQRKFLHKRTIGRGMDAKTLLTGEFARIAVGTEKEPFPNMTEEQFNKLVDLHLK